MHRLTTLFSLLALVFLAGCGSVTRSVSLSTAELQITTTMLATATASAPYQQTLAATGGTLPYSWSVTGGSLPAGLSLAGNGVINGTPTQVGSYTFNVHVTDGIGAANSASLSINVIAALAIATSSLPTGTVSVAYDQSLAATGGVAPYSWSVVSGALPPGLALSSTGRLSGTSTLVGVFTFTVQVADAASATKTASFTLTVNASLSIITTALPGGTVGSAYEQQLAAAGGSAPYTWKISSGALPAGLLLETTGIISGTPVGAGSSAFTVQVTDANAATKAGSLSIVVIAALTITTSSLPEGIVSAAYNQSLAATGGVPPYSWTVTSGALPAGLVLSAAGVVSGIPNAAGTSTFAVRVTDSASVTRTASIALKIDPTSTPPLTITTASLPGGTVATAYQQALTASGGTSPYNWSTLIGSLPPGLTLVTNGTLSGTPTQAGSSTFTVQVADSASATKTATFVLSVAAALSITTTSVPGGTAGTAYREALAASGGTPPYAWSLASGALPPGLSLSFSGTISGTPTDSGSYGFAIQVTDAASETQAASLSIVVQAASTFQYVLGDTHYPYSTQSQPASKGASFVDSTYLLPVTRVTTTAADRGTYGTITEYPTYDPSSMDGQYLIFQSCGSQSAYQNAGCGGYVLYNGQTFAYISDLSASAQSPLLGWDGQEPEDRWNRGATQNNHAFTYRKHMQLREYNVDTGTDVLIHDFCNEFGPSGTIAQLSPCATDATEGYYVFMHEYGSPSVDTRYYAFYVKNSGTPYDDRFAFVYDRTLDQVVGHKDISTAPDGMLGVHMSPSGSYIIINYFCGSGDTAQEQCGPTAYTRDFSAWTKVGNYPDHMGYAWTAQGHEVIAMTSAGTDEMEFTRLDTGATYQIYPAVNMDYPGILYTYQNNHGWIFAGTYGGSFNKSVWSNESDAGPGQIFAFELDETKCDRWYDSYDDARNQNNPHACATSNQRIWRIAFTQDLYEGGAPYFMQVNPQVNYAGTKLWFGSNWRDVATPPEVYEVDLPATWVNDLRTLP